MVAEFLRPLNLNFVASKQIFLELHQFCDLKSAVQIILRNLHKLLEVDAACIRLFHDGDGEMSFLSSCDIEEEIRKIFSQDHINFLCNKVFDRNFSGIKSHITDFGSFYSNHLPHFLQSLKNNGFYHIGTLFPEIEGKSMAVIPIVANSKNIGFIQLWDRQFNKFESDQIYFLEMIAQILGSKILLAENPELFTDQEYREIIISFCAYCKRVHKKNQWISLEEFFDSTNFIKKIVFSHTICPQCFEKIVDL